MTTERKREIAKTIKQNSNLLKGRQLEKLIDLFSPPIRGSVTDILTKISDDIPSRFYKSIPEGTFFGNSDIQTVKLLTPLEIIGVLSFSKCRKLEEMILPKTLKYIDDRAFLDSTLLLSLVYMGTKDEWKMIEPTFHENWNKGSSIIRIVCSDGDIEL